MEDEFDALVEKGYWFSLVPKSKKVWHAVIYKKNPQDTWDAIEWKQTPTLKKGMKWIEKNLEKKLFSDFMKEED